MGLGHIGNQRIAPMRWYDALERRERFELHDGSPVNQITIDCCQGFWPPQHTAPVAVTRAKFEAVQGVRGNSDTASLFYFERFSYRTAQDLRAFPLLCSASRPTNLT